MDYFGRLTVSSSIKIEICKKIYSDEISYISPKKVLPHIFGWLLIRCKINKILITCDACWLSAE